MQKTKKAREELMQDKEREMREAAKRLDFELAAILRDEIRVLSAGKEKTRGRPPK